jgi:glyoxylase-like metal-dependent hydrolase (beta-lactamase superfamily II)
LPTVTSAAPLLRVGDIDIWAVLDGRMHVGQPPGFPPEGSPDFAVHADYLRDGRWLIDIGGFLVRTGDRLVLIDAGAGSGDGALFTPDPRTDQPELVEWVRANGVDDPDQIEHFLRQLVRTDIRTGSFAANLAALGFGPEDVTDVLISHLHFDHIGWVSDGRRPYFPNAVVRCEHHDAEYFLAPDHEDGFYRVLWDAMPTSERMAPVLDRFETWSEDATVVPGITCVFAPGHTPGSSIFSITSGTDRALILGDTVHCPQELVDPDFVMGGGDVDFERANRTRDAIRHEVEHGDVPFAASHFFGLRFGRLHAGDRPRQWRFEWADADRP